MNNHEVFFAHKNNKINKSLKVKNKTVLKPCLYLDKTWVLCLLQIALFFLPPRKISKIVIPELPQIPDHILFKQILAYLNTLSNHLVKA